MVVALSCSAGSDNIQHRLESLLNNPSSTTLENCKNAGGPSLTDCAINGGFNNENRAELYTLIRSGDTYAFQAGLLAFSCWDGGELEDFYRSAGQFFDKRPDEFMHLTRDYRVDNYPLERMVSMLPLELTDNFDGKLALVEQRIGLLKKVEDPNAQLLIPRLEESKSRLERVKKEMRSMEEKD